MSTIAATVKRIPDDTDTSLFSAFRKWGRIFSVFVQDALIYRAVAVVWILTDTIPTLVMPLIWFASFHGRSEIAGYNPGELSAYYLVLLAIGNFVTCHTMWEIAADIKEGKFAAFLLRPVSYMGYHYLGYLAWRIMRLTLFVPVFCVAAYLFRGSLDLSHIQPGGYFFLALFLGHLCSFFITYPLGLLALYVVETRSLFNFWYIPLVIFNGQVAPLAMFPPYARALAELLPFRYTVAFPTELFLGRLSTAQIHSGLLHQAFWVVFGYGLSVFLWRNGLKRFTGVGL